MIFAELKYPGRYEEMHEELTRHIIEHFVQVEHGIQCDSWIQVSEADQVVTVDSFLSRKHLVRSSRPCLLVQKVIAVLQLKYAVHVFDKPEYEAHEDEEEDGV